MDEVIYVLHCFKKKSKQGIKIPKTDIDLIKQRLKPVLYQSDIVRHSVAVVLCNKAQYAGKGVPFSSTATRLQDTTATPYG
ncbi:MAG: type II toxin-antitoxin system RelE/ParE family toxin [Burkholderiales bacterium]|nr:type II toxin-antitoxin system RelE/ParE family toxin [Burkholderiales bacterium]